MIGDGELGTYLGGFKLFFSFPFSVPLALVCVSYMYAPPQYKELDMRSKQPQYQRFLSGVQTETDPNKQTMVSGNCHGAEVYVGRKYLASLVITRV
jgi:hypothetical protein